MLINGVCSYGVAFPSNKLNCSTLIITFNEHFNIFVYKIALQFTMNSDNMNSTRLGSLNGDGPIVRRSDSPKMSPFQ